MNIFALNKEGTEEKEMLQYLGVENVAFRLESRESTYLSCTCGFCDSVVDYSYGFHRWNTSMRKENGKEVFFCPACKTETVYSIESEDEEFTLKYFHEVKQDTEENFDVEITQLNLRRDGSHIDVYLNDPSLLVRFFKKTKEIRFFETYEDVKVDEFDTLTELETLENIFRGYRNVFEFDFVNIPQSHSYSGLDEIAETFRTYIPNICHVDCNDEDMDLYSLLLDMYLSNKSKLYSYIRDEKNDYGYAKYHRFSINCRDIDEVQETLDFIEGYGVDCNCSTLEEATGMTEKELLSINGFRDLLFTKSFYDKIKEADLETYLEELDISFDSDERISLWSLYEKAEQPDFGNFMKYICRCHKSENISVNDVISMIREILTSENKEAKKIIDFKKAFSANTYKRYQLIKNEVISYDMLERFSKKPTVDNMLRLIKES